MSYEELDAAIVARITTVGSATYADLRKETENLADAMIAPDRWDKSPNGWRLIDRRLQAMRKAGKIVYKRGGWWIP